MVFLLLKIYVKYTPITRFFNSEKSLFHCVLLFYRESVCVPGAQSFRELIRRKRRERRILRSRTTWDGEQPMGAARTFVGPGFAKRLRRGKLVGQPRLTWHDARSWGNDAPVLSRRKSGFRATVRKVRPVRQVRISRERQPVRRHLQKQLISLRNRRRRQDFCAGGQILIFQSEKSIIPGPYEKDSVPSVTVSADCRKFGKGA